MLLITHDLEAAAGVSDRIAVMYSGEVVEVGATDEILSSPMHPYTKGLLNSLPSHGLEPLPGDSPLLNALPKGCRFAPRCPLAREPCRTVHPPLVRAGATRLARCDALC
ncbi:MAG: Trehalose/maltose import ATP-binding protein MalK [Methanoregulaceae archaeon PtaB.Bin108]|nr:MAG: Trehalose/maltose import ATP-binding protein MalK [Methanoregulaceae archaeon PtaB.Bin108]